MILAPCLRGLAVFTLVCVPVFAGTTQEQARAGQAKASGGADTDRSTVPPLPALPTVKLAPVAGFDDDSAFVRSIAARVDGLVTRADRVDDPTKRADLLAAAANLVLARQLEPACSKRLLRFHSDEEVFDEAETRAALARADELLIRAQNTLDKPNESKEPPEGGLAETDQRIQKLQVLALALRSYLLAGEGKESAGDVRHAASRLASLLEDQSRPVAAAATLWHACLRSRDSDPSRALSVLDQALADPPPESMPYAFFARLLRCRLIAERGGRATALAMLMQIEERCEDWLTDDANRADAVRTAQLVRIQILTDWYRRLGTSGAAGERRWCARRIKTLVEEHFGKGSSTLLRLTPAIPTIVQPPEPDSRNDDGAPNGG